MTVLVFLGTLGLLVAVHEWGHYRMAVACGVKVLTFSVGFGRPLLRWRARRPFPGQSTEFMICLIPLGGYVKMLDENEEVVAPGDVSMALNRQSLWRRAAIVSAGPLANLLLAVVLYAATFWLGQYESKPLLASPALGSVAESVGLRGGDLVLRVGLSEATLHEVESMEALRWWALQEDTLHEPLVLEVESAQNHRIHTVSLRAPASIAGNAQELSGLSVYGLGQLWSPAVIGNVQEGSAAQRAGLQRGDVVLHIDGHPMEDAAMLRAWVRAAGERGPVPLQVWAIRRPHQGELMVEVTPERVWDKDRYVGRIGAYVGEPPARVWVQAGFIDGVSRAFVRTSEVIGLTLDMVGRMVVGSASLDNLSGPLSMADDAGRSASIGLSAYLSYLALISISLGVLNLMPLPVLDGGHLLYYLYEALTGRPPAAQWLDVLQRLGLLMLVALMVFSLFNDLVRLGWLS